MIKSEETSGSPLVEKHLRPTVKEPEWSDNELIWLVKNLREKKQ